MFWSELVQFRLFLILFWKRSLDRVVIHSVWEYWLQNVLLMCFSQDISWSGLQFGDLFNRPKAVMMLSVDGMPQGDHLFFFIWRSKWLQIKGSRKFNLIFFTNVDGFNQTISNWRRFKFIFSFNQKCSKCQKKYFSLWLICLYHDRTEVSIFNR